MNIETAYFINKLQNYQLLNHRIALIKETINNQGVILRYFNCSKCTNTFAFQGIGDYIKNKILFSGDLACEERYIEDDCYKIFIIGGILNSPVEYIYHDILKNQAFIVLYGQDKDNIKTFLLSRGIPGNIIYCREKMKEAMEQTKILTKSLNKLTNVFLTPCCPSFDEFKDFEERGEIFANLI